MVDQLYIKDIFDDETEVHYAFHSTLKKTTDMHFHDFYEFFLITKGKVKHLVNSSIQELCEGDLVFIRPDDRHYYENLAGEYCEYINLAFSKELMSKLIAYIGDLVDIDELVASPCPMICNLLESQVGILLNRINHINMIPLEEKSRKRLELRILLVDLFSRYQQEKARHDHWNIPAWLRKALHEMQLKDNFQEGIPAMIRLCHISHEHLCRITKNYLKKSPTEIITEIRLNYTTNLLVNTDYRITDIALEAGFNNHSHFFHLFKNTYGLSPAEFRKEGTVPLMNSSL